MTQIAIVGTAGRDKTKPLTPELWDWMLDDAARRVPSGSDLVSGGAAWADHLAVALFLCGHAKSLTLHLPAPLVNGEFMNRYSKCAVSANHYHNRFSEIIGLDSHVQLHEAVVSDRCTTTIAMDRSGYNGFFERNTKVAQANELIAYTFGTGSVPADGGTKDTWNKCKGNKIHVPLPQIKIVDLFDLCNTISHPSKTRIGL